MLLKEEILLSYWFFSFRLKQIIVKKKLNDSNEMIRKMEKYWLYEHLMKEKLKLV